MFIGWIKKYFKHDNTLEFPLSQEMVDAEYQVLEPYIEIPLDAREERCMLLIVASIAAGDERYSQFKIKSVKKENPIYKRVSIIASSIAADQSRKSNFKIKMIKVRKGEKNVTKI